MLKAFVNCWKIPELRRRILTALGLLFVARMGASIPLPGLDPVVLENAIAGLASAAGGTTGTAFAMYNLFTGGALLKGAVFALGIMPYISASIIMQLMGAVVPSISRLQQEGDIGRQKIAQYSRYLTILIALIQGGLLASALTNPTAAAQVLGLAGVGNLEGLVVIDKWLFVGLSLVLLTTGSMIMCWLGEQITQRGIGNGTSILITVNILADMPNAVKDIVRGLFSHEVGSSVQRMTWEGLLLVLVLWVVVYAAMVAVTQTIRRIPVQYAKRLVGRKMYGGQSSYLPLKINFAGVMPVIFASAIISFPAMLFNWVGALLSPKGGVAADIGVTLTGWAHFLGRGTSFYYLCEALLIFGFSYFWVSLMFKPVQIADELKKNSGYIPGVRPGDPTAQFLDFVMTRLTVAGATFLVCIALLPDMLTQASWLHAPQRLSYLLGGTGGLIAVGVSLDTMAQIEAILLQRHYEGFLKKGRIGGISMPVPTRKVADFGETQGLGKLGYICVTILVLGIAAAIYNFQSLAA